MTNQLSTKQEGEGSQATVSIVETSKLLPWLMLVCIIAGLSLGISFWAKSDADRASEQWAQSYKTLERENRLLQLEVDGFKVALDKAGIPTGHEKP